jgi:hypothetical protein
VCKTSNLIAAEKGPTSQRLPPLEPKAVKTSGCFIATAVYGSPIAPEVLFLRRFRDEILLPSKLGSLLVDGYYYLSPPLAALISKTKLLRSATKYLLLLPILWLIKVVRSDQT